jgi:tetratricopeptide (TPR) repeat protein
MLAALLVPLGLPAGQAAPPDSTRIPTLLVPSHPDSAPPESEPAPLLMPGRAGSDSLDRDPAARARQHFAMARAYEESSPGAAIVSYRTALRLDPGIPEAHYRAGLLFMTRSQYAEAAKHFAAELQNQPDHADATRELGIALARQGDHAQAIPVLERLIGRHPRDGRNWHAAGFAYLVAKRSRDAEAALRRAIELPPPSAEEHRDLGAVLAQAGRPREARIQYRRALILSPRDAGTWINLANLERRAGRFDDALAAYRRAEQSDSTATLAYQGQVEMLRERERLAEAGDVYRRWVRAAPAEHVARIDAIRLFEGLGRGDIALELARDGVRRAGDQGEPWLIYGMALAKEGRLRSALEQLRQAESTFGSDHSGRERAAKVIAALRAAAPDSLRELFRADSAAHSTRQP